jgi:hypothetical protein
MKRTFFLRHASVGLLGGLGLFVLACSSSTTSGGGGNGGTGGHAASSSSSTSSSTSSSGAGGGCQGNQASWDALTAAPIACTSNSDCCVIVNGCLSQAQIVAATKKTEAAAAWPYCESMCNDCIPPAIQVGCDNGTCVGTVVGFPDASPDLLMDHCGVDTPIGFTPGKLHFGCGGG